MSQGEGALVAAVFSQGIRDACYAARDLIRLREKKPQAEITDFKNLDHYTGYRWFMSDAYYPFSFAWCGDSFDIDPGRARSAVMAKFLEIAKRGG